MSDTVKLIIEIPRNEYEYTCNMTLHDRSIWDNAIRNGTPLANDSERAEAQAYFDGEAYGWEQGRKALIEDIKAEIKENIATRESNKSMVQNVGLYLALEIIDKHIKGVNEE